MSFSVKKDYPGSSPGGGAEVARLLSSSSNALEDLSSPIRAKSVVQVPVLLLGSVKLPKTFYMSKENS